MQFNKLSWVFWMVFGLISCQNINSETAQLQTIEKDSLQLNPDKGLVFYENKPFTGIAIQHQKDGKKSVAIEYLNGKKHGFYRKYFYDQTLSFESQYQHGKQDGKTKSWWKNGNLRSESIYENGVPNGVQWQWYKNGAKFKRTNLVKGREDGLQKAWRKNGKIYNNYEVKNGRIFGLKRSTLCYELEDENIKYDDDLDSLNRLESQ